MLKWVARVGQWCVGCGACMQVCPKQAVEVRDGVRAVVDQERCVGCGLCVAACPAGVMERVERGSHEA